MIVRLKLSALRETSGREYLIRFALGGAATVVAGLIAAGFGPAVGGLFLAFPAIFPASATLVEKHVRERKEKAGLAGSRRGKEAAALDAVGAALGSFGLCGLRRGRLAHDRPARRSGSRPGDRGLGRRRGDCLAIAARAVKARRST